MMYLFFVGFGGFVVLLACVNWWYRKSLISQITSRRVFITGTDSGFGLKLALDLDKRGVKVYAGCFTEKGAENIQKIASDGLKTIAIDITQENSVNRAKATILEDLQPGEELWGLVNNAGILPNGLLFPISTPSDYKRAMDVNFFGTMNVTNAFWPLIKRSSGRIVNVISIAGRCSIGIEPYTCSKHALEPYTNGLRRWMKNFGSHVAIIEPGIFKSTEILSGIQNLTMENMKENGLQSIKEECGEPLIQAVIKDSLSYISNSPLSGWNHLAMVTDAMQHALLAKHPKDRYICGHDAKYLYRFQPFVTDWLNDHIIAAYLPSISAVLKKD